MIYDFSNLYIDDIYILCFHLFPLKNNGFPVENLYEIPESWGSRILRRKIPDQARVKGFRSTASPQKREKQTIFEDSLKITTQYWIWLLSLFFGGGC